MSNNRIVVVARENSSYVTLGTNFQLSKNWISDSFKDTTEQESEATLALFASLENVAGIQSVTLRKYEVSIEIFEAFRWSEVLPTAVNLINTYRMTLEHATDAVDYMLRDDRSTYKYGEMGEQITTELTPLPDYGLGDLQMWEA